MKKNIVFHPTVCSTACSSPDHTCVSLQRCANFTITFFPLIQINSLIALKSDGRKETVSDEQGRTGIHVSGPGSLLFEQPQLPVSLTVISKVLAQSRRAKINLQTARTPKSLHFNYTHLTKEINKNGRKKKITLQNVSMKLCSRSFYFLTTCCNCRQQAAKFSLQEYPASLFGFTTGVFSEGDDGSPLDLLNSPSTPFWDNQGHCQTQTIQSSGFKVTSSRVHPSLSVQEKKKP